MSRTAANQRTTKETEIDIALDLDGSGQTDIDTGLPPVHGYVRNVAAAVNFCEEATTEDLVGHSSFMAGVIASQEECTGFAPDASLYFVRVFDSSQASITAWLLEG